MHSFPNVVRVAHRDASWLAGEHSRLSSMIERDRLARFQGWS